MSDILGPRLDSRRLNHSLNVRMSRRSQNLFEMAVDWCFHRQGFGPAIDFFQSKRIASAGTSAAAGVAAGYAAHVFVIVFMMVTIVAAVSAGSAAAAAAFGSWQKLFDNDEALFDPFAKNLSEFVR